MDPRKLYNILELCEKIQEVSACIFGEVGDTIKEHEEMAPDPEKLAAIPLQYMAPELVSIGQIAPATKPATDDQIQTITEHKAWENFMAESLYSISPDLLLYIGGLKELVGRLDSLTQIILYKDLDGND